MAARTFVPSNGGFSGRFVNAILPDREIANRVYATTINTTTGGGFFFVSNDGGASWQPSMRNMPPRLIGYSIFQDERDANVIYLGTNLGLIVHRSRRFLGASHGRVSPRPADEEAAGSEPSRSAPSAERSTTAPKTGQPDSRKAQRNNRCVAHRKLWSKPVMKSERLMVSLGRELLRSIRISNRSLSCRLPGNWIETTLGALGSIQCRSSTPTQLMFDPYRSGERVGSVCRA